VGFTALVGSHLVLALGLTGGIGSGKSTVARLLAERGAIIIDADRIAREVVEPGEPAFAAIVERFGPTVVKGDGRLDRTALARLIFADSKARKDLEAITHPAIGRVMAERLAEQAETDHVVILDIPLLAEKGRMGVSGVIVVDCPEEIAIDRLVRCRGFDAKDAQRRVAVQMAREERLALADVVVDNSGQLEALGEQIATTWAWIESLGAMHA
jgi:dephospho-CoA kinase